MGAIGGCCKATALDHEVFILPAGDEVRPIGTETGTPESPQLAPLWALLRSDRFKASVGELGGYPAKEIGRRVR